MEEQENKLAREYITQHLINKRFDPEVRSENDVLFSNKNILFEQYKLLIDSAHRIEERRGGSNSVFIGINTIIVSVLIQSIRVSEIDIMHMPLIALVFITGMFTSWSWLNVIASYKKLNFLNYVMMQELEELLPSRIFSLRAKIETGQSSTEVTKRANVILMNETLMPKGFLFVYAACFLAILVIFAASNSASSLSLSI